MGFNLDKLASMAKERPQESIKKAQYRKENRTWLKLSQEIALSLHYYLKSMNMTQKDFAALMGVSPSYVGKLLKGNENLSLKTICEIQDLIHKDLISILLPNQELIHTDKDEKELACCD